MKFFVEIDRETIKQIDVTMQPGPVFRARISLLLDRGRQAGISLTELKGTPALRHFLEDQDVAEEAIIAELGEKPRKSSHRPHLSATTLACVVLAGGSVALAHYWM